MDRVERLSQSYYDFEPDAVEVDAPELEYPTVLLRLIDSPSGPAWFKRYLAGLDRDALASDDPAERVRLTKDDPLLFALVYLVHHLHSAETQERLSFADFHRQVIEAAKEWKRKSTRPRQYRSCWVTPRGMGKSTWLFCLLPIWAAAHGHIKFIVAFSDSADQAKNHLATIRGEFDTNELLIQDFPELCMPKVRRTGGSLAKKTVSARVDKIEQANDFIMMAKGSGTAARGLKSGKRRPDLIILDDIEPGEEKYSPSVMVFRLRWMLETVFHLNEFARVVIVGTVTAPGSVMHQLVESVLHPTEDTPDWIQDQEIVVHYYPPIILNEDGTERSCWPAKWTLAYLKSHEDKQDYKKEFLNQPVNAQGDYWTDDDFLFEELETAFDVLSIDPAVTSKDSSHNTGLAIVGFNVERKVAVVKFATVIRQPPKKMRETVLWYLDQFPEIGLVRVESNQGGDTWAEVFHDIPVRVELTWSELPKELRFTRLLNYYQRGKVYHHHQLVRLQQEMCAYREGDNDMIDAVEIGVRKFITRQKPRTSGGTYSYAQRTPLHLLVSGGD
ncbi:MAG: hypothetical protein ABSG46_20180 [Candidatus Binataceae bacterium]